MQERNPKKIWITAGLSVLLLLMLVFLDQWTKCLAVRNLKGAADVVLIRGVLKLHYLENRGMAFGLLQGFQILFTVLTVAVLFLAVLIFLRLSYTKRFVFFRILLVLIAAGAVGNSIDRIANGYVVDFIYFSLIDFPVFNVADCYVTVSCILMAVLILFVYKDDELKGLLSFRKKASPEAGETASAPEDAETPEVPETPEAPEEETK